MPSLAERNRRSIRRRRPRGPLAAVLFACLALVPATPGWAEIAYHVSVDGSDENRGTAERPFRSVARAQQAVRARLRETAEEPVTVLIHPGTYRLAAPLTFTSADSGRAGAPVTYRAAGGGEVVLSGGMPIDGWTKDGRLWRARVEDVARGDLYFHQLWVGGRRARPARAPNRFYLRTAGPIQPLGDRQKARRDPSRMRGFRFREGDIRRWKNPDDVYIELYHSWTTSLHWIESVDPERRILRFTNRSHWPVGYWETFERYRVHHCFEALDAPGEWYLDRRTGTLYYLPRPGEDMTTVQVIAPRLTDLVRFEGEPGEGRFVRHLRLEGLSFQHEDWALERTDLVDGQAHARQQNAALTAFGLRDAAIERCELAHVGGHAVRLDEGCQNVRIARCHIHDCGGGGIYVGPDAKVGYMPSADALKVQGNTIENNFIHHTSFVLGGAIGIWVGSASFNKIRHNEISDFDYTGISVGWCWGRDTDIFQRGNLIEYNHVHHNVGDILSDNGGIYVLGYSPGSVIRGNVIHHIRHYPYINDSRGLYLDGNTSEYLVEQNLVHHIDSFGIMLKGQHNRVRHNIFAFCGESGFNRLFKAHAKDYEYDPSTLRRNIVYQREGAMTSGYYAPRWTRIDHNVYWSTRGPAAVRFNDWSSRILEGAPRIENVPLTRWQELGRDPHSVVADPRFRDPGAGDFRLAPDSPADAVGFDAFDHGRAGLCGEAAWTAMPHGVEREPHVYAPPPPSWFPLEEGFERYEVGTMPLLPGRLMEGAHGRIRVTDRVAADGRKSLEFTDAPADRGWLPHWAVRFRQGEGGRIAMACDFLNDAQQPARFRVEFRDWSGQRYHGGPTVTVEPDGAVRAGGKTLGSVPPGRWAHLVVRFTGGPDAPKTCTVSLGVRGGKRKTIADVPFASTDFATCTWFGISSLGNEKARYCLDNVRLTVGDGGR